jgi:glutathione synthase/RimK-type ligase-like ATP-grasp enzyme
MAKKLPKIGLLYLDYVLRFFDRSNFRGWPDKIETVVYHWKGDEERFIKEVKKKGIDVLIGNIPATAYETFRKIARELPDVRFIPSLDSQFANKSKENVTRFCWKYDIPVPKTYIFYNKEEGMEFLKNTDYPKIIKRSYGPSNYGGYYVHKVDSFEEAKELLEKKRYCPIYVQDFVPMEADIRVMLIGHKPVCAFWRRPPEGHWLTNTSQGGSMDYMNVPKGVLDLAVEVSKAAKAEYWACDIAVGKDGEYRILECATAFAAFPYIRDWIGQYLMWLLSEGKFPKPNIPIYNWEELGKIDSSLLRTMRYITFGRYIPSQDGAIFLNRQKMDESGAVHKIWELDEEYPMLPVEPRKEEEWPSEKWDFTPKCKGFWSKKEENKKEEGGEEHHFEEPSDEDPVNFKEKDLKSFLQEAVGKKKAKKILEQIDAFNLVFKLEHCPDSLLEIKGIKEKTLKKLLEAWKGFVYNSAQKRDAI